MTGSEDDLKKMVRPQWGWRTYLSIALSIVILYATAVHLELNFWDVLTNFWTYIQDLAGRMFPPDTGDLTELLISMVETIEIALWGTFLAIILSIPLGIASARNIAPHPAVFLLSRVFTIFFRAVPEFILAMFLVIAVGFGAISGVFALGLHTMGFLSKFYAEDIEHIALEPVDALTATGANKVQIFLFAVIPQILPSFVGYNLYILDRNIRMATMLGIVGAGGIGYDLISSFRMFQYQKVTTIIMIIFVTILIIDFISSWIRKKLA
ncbi:MAG: phosphonate ABC transporter, permease protein PhnE [Proteobacteria bacterium]|nr:phosphonate ABC transporter, permease protein PhnE [Pseudomonadota bacterium]